MPALRESLLSVEDIHEKYSCFCAFLPNKKNKVFGFASSLKIDCKFSRAIPFEKIKIIVKHCAVNRNKSNKSIWRELWRRTGNHPSHLERRPFRALPPCGPNPNRPLHGDSIAREFLVPLKDYTSREVVYRQQYFYFFFISRLFLLY
jgi:hypothetical protein